MPPLSVIIRGNLPAIYLVAGVAIAAMLEMALIDDEEERQRRLALPEQLAMTLLNARWRERLGGQEEEQQPKCAHLNWNREPSTLRVEEDYWKLIPRFRDLDFERVF